MNYCDRERNRVLNELDMVSQGANQMRLLLAKEDLDAEVRERAERVFGSSEARHQDAQHFALTDRCRRVVIAESVTQLLSCETYFAEDGRG